MIYATDLDRTLIYSDKFLEMHPCEDDMILVDDCKSSSYISSKVLSQLKNAINSGVIFIPVTARSIKEYNRIKIPGITPEYAITTCGGVILHNGVRLAEWDAFVSEVVKLSELDLIRIELDKLEDVNYTSKIIDNAYVFTKFDIRNKDRLRAELHRLSKEFDGYTFRVDKHKIYAMPVQVNKESALTWLRSLLGEPELIASGDGENDVSFLNSADLAIIPDHCTINVASDIEVDYMIVNNGAISPMQTISFILNSMHVE